MGDMNPVIVPKSDQINADDLIAGPMTITIASAKVAPGTEQPVSLGIAGQRKVFRPCKGMCRIMVQAWGADSQKFIGKSLTLYRDPDVTWGGAKIGGIRISHMSDIPSVQVFAVSESKTKRKLVQVKPLQSAPTRSTPATVAETGPEPEADAGEVAASASGGALFEPSPFEAAGIRCETKIKALATAADIAALRRDREFIADLKAVGADNPSLHETLMRTLDNAKADIEGEVS
jgi:hypothetical protein